MKTLIIKTFFVLFLLTNVSQTQNWIYETEGIPVHTWLWWGFTDNSNYPGAIDSMKSIVDIVTTDIGIAEDLPNNPDPSEQINLLKAKGLKLLANRSRTSTTSMVYNWIQHYTDAKYSIWEAEGTPNSVSEAMLEYDPGVMRIITEDSVSYLKLRKNRSGIIDTLIRGPYYDQDIYYYASQDSITEVRYTADFRLKLDYNNNYPTQMDNPNDTICIIKVTYSDHAGLDTLGTTYTVAAETLQRYEFQNYFKEFSIKDYRLDIFPENSTVSNQPPPQYTFSAYIAGDTLVPGPRKAKRYIQFKVIWLGKPQYLLSIDKVTVSDDRGSELIDPSSDARDNIIAQANSLGADDLIVGWLGIDEPVSIDIFEPIKLVTELLKNNSQNMHPLWIALMGHWSGTWENPGNEFGTMKLSPWSEMKKRIGDMNIWQNIYMYDYPYQDNYTYDISWLQETDWRSANIKVVSKLNYKQAYNLNPNFGVSLQCGEVHNTQAYERNIADYELLYNTNLALMNGAKFLSLYTYFAQRDTTKCDSGYTCHAIVDLTPGNQLIYTDKYYMLKNIIKPRLKGLMGKTLKKLTPTEQFLNIDASNSYNFISHFSGNLECLPATSDYDLGFFADSLSRDYFMIVSRYYNYSGSCPIFINLDEGCLYNNLILTKYVADTTYSILRSDPILVNLTRGDAELYRIYPVVRWGGSLLANDTINTGETLYDDMTIENGATLTVNGTYYANANITVKNGGKIVAGENANISFESGKNLIIDGTAEIKGTSANRLSITAFHPGIIIEPGSSLTMDYCDVISNGYAITTESGPQSYVNISNSNINAQHSGISLVASSSYEGFQTPPVPVIQNCIITATFSGINVSNYRSVLLKSNTFTNCGVSVSNVASAYIQDNDISVGTHQNYPGVLFNNSGGYIRNNTIKNRANGIHLANSSPDIGGNLIENNYLHGLYIAGSSFPNLIGQLQTNPPAYYPLAGYNRIRNNGNNTKLNSANDGSEIYFSFSDARLGTLKRPGCNEISDDRTATPSM
ncbi:MAG: right-handed parallel beta-helix repeat-containing protein [Ignavibacteriaceae bacterium]|jgi:hypothetical protein|nr:right-handed parallel beta-helix repeat-containing protein [Ignavibacteriaceae bacterium]